MEHFLLSHDGFAICVAQSICRLHATDVEMYHLSAAASGHTRLPTYNFNHATFKSI